jgi:hypothetical protein
MSDGWEEQFGCLWRSTAELHLPCEGAVCEYLADREGKGFPLELVIVRLEDGAEVPAYVPVLP